MKIIFGLGNPGPRYSETRHNCGFMTIDELAEKLDCSESRNLLDNQIFSGRYKGHRILLAKPQSYMNLSGFPVSKLCAYYKVPYEDIIVIHDDMDLALGALRIRRGGSDGGHNGLKSIIAQTGTNKINRVKIGISHGSYNIIDHVISPFSQEERPIIKSAVSRAADAVICWLEDGVDAAMNRFNHNPQPEEKAEK